jgi:hypothetical protein
MHRRLAPGCMARAAAHHACCAAHRLCLPGIQLVAIVKMQDGEGAGRHGGWQAGLQWRRVAGLEGRPRKHQRWLQCHGGARRCDGESLSCALWLWVLAAGFANGGSTWCKILQLLGT